MTDSAELKPENDFEHYFNATIRLAARVKQLEKELEAYRQVAMNHWKWRADHVDQEAQALLNGEKE